MPKHAQLVDQPTKTPVRKVRWATYLLAVLTVATYVVGAAQGEEVISTDAVGDALEVLVAGGLPLVAAYVTKAEA